jgi:hypothetical protein
MQTKLENSLEELALLKAEMDKYQTIKSRYDELKFDILQEMTASQSKRTESKFGVYAVRAQRSSVRIIDETIVKNWLAANNFELDSFVRLDPAMVTPVVKTAMKVDGEVVPGTELTTTEYLSIREDKES